MSGVSSTAHEHPCEQLRGPVRALAALFELLGATALDETQRRYLTLAREALASLNDGLSDKATPSSSSSSLPAPAPAREDDAHRAVVVAVAARDVAATALALGALRVRLPALAARLEQHLGRREWAALDAAITGGAITIDEAVASPITPAVVARFEATVRREHARLATDIDAALHAAVALEPLRAQVTSMAHRFAGTAASFGHAALGDEARAVSLALRTSDDDQLLPLAQRLLTALAAANGSSR